MKQSSYRDRGGRWRVRVRDRYVRDVVRPLIEQNAVGVVKLDLVLRGLASLQAETPGLIPAELAWDDVHDLCRDRSQYRASDRKLKRGWVSDKLGRLEDLGLITRRTIPGHRSEITVLSDTGTKEPFDDPGAKGDQYVTFLGGLAEFGHLGMWSAAELAAYLSAMHAERHTRSSPPLAAALDLNTAPPYGGRWFRPLHWFGDGTGKPQRPESHIRYGFAERTLQRGIASLQDRGLMFKEYIIRDPRNGDYFDLPRTLYHNGFDELLHTASYRKRRLTERTAFACQQREERFPTLFANRPSRSHDANA